MDRATRLVYRIPPLPDNGIDLVVGVVVVEEEEEEEEEWKMKGSCYEFPWM